MVLKEGYLYKTKKIKRAFRAVTSTKLRFFVLLYVEHKLTSRFSRFLFFFLGANNADKEGTLIT